MRAWRAKREIKQGLPLLSVLQWQHYSFLQLPSGVYPKPIWSNIVAPIYSVALRGFWVINMVVAHCGPLGEAQVCALVQMIFWACLSAFIVHLIEEPQ